MRSKTLCVIIIGIMFISCQKQRNAPVSSHILTKTVRTIQQLSQIADVTYFSYDGSGRIIQSATYRIDSTGISLDSTLNEKYTFHYTGASNLYDSYTIYYQHIGSPNSESYSGIRIYDNFQRLTYDSLWLVNSLINPYPYYDVSKLIYRNTDTVFRSTNSLSFNQFVYGMDTMIFSNGNLVKSIERKTNNVPATILSTYDINPNPVPFAWPQQLGYTKMLSNLNNASIRYYSTAQDSIKYTHIYNYDTDGYPLVEQVDQTQYWPYPHYVNFTTKYLYQ